MHRHHACVLALMAATACSHPRGESSPVSGSAVTGTVTYRERVALPADAQADVQLIDATMRDSVPRVITSTTVRADGRQVPLAFTLPYDARTIDRTHLYTIRAVINGGHEVLFANDIASPVITQGNPMHVDLVLSRVDPTTSSGRGDLAGSSWVLLDLNGDGVVTDTHVTLDFDGKGRATGNGSCNRYFATVEISGSSIRFGAVGATRMACATAVSLQEVKYFEALESANRFVLEDGALSIYGGASRPLRFTRATP
jgi:putative lipoprotein